jgi:hydrogenase maturation protein HypF
MARRAITVRGIVQGVGFRPFVHELARRLGLGGFVRNQTGAVSIEVEGEPTTLDQFLAELTAGAPPLARIATVAADVAAGTPPRSIARRFHSTLAELIVAVCGRLRDGAGLHDVVLSGGVFMNALLLTECVARLEQAAFRVHRHRLVPPNDGGLCLGQLAIAGAAPPGV